MSLSTLFDVAIGVGLIGWAIDVVVRGLRARRWPHVAGTITESTFFFQPLKSWYGWSPKVRYRYTVGHQSFEGDRIAFGSFALREWFAEQFAEQHHVGASVAVHYDPRHHEQSVLYPSIGLAVVRTAIGFVSGVLLFTYGMMMILSPDVGEPDHLQRARDFMSKGWKRDAEVELRRAIELHPNDPEPHFWMGDFLLGAHQNTRAAAEFQAALRIRPHGPSYAGLAYLALDRKAFTEASELASRAIALDPGYKEGYGYLVRAVALHHVGKDLEALRDASSACKLGNRQACEILKEWKHAQGIPNN